MRDLSKPFVKAKPFSFSDQKDAYMVGVSPGYRTATNYADMIASPLGISMSKLMGE